MEVSKSAGLEMTLAMKNTAEAHFWLEKFIGSEHEYYAHLHRILRQREEQEGTAHHVVTGGTREEAILAAAAEIQARRKEPECSEDVVKEGSVIRYSVELRINDAVNLVAAARSTQATRQGRTQFHLGDLLHCAEEYLDHHIREACWNADLSEIDFSWGTELVKAPNTVKEG